MKKDYFFKNTKILFFSLGIFLMISFIESSFGKDLKILESKLEKLFCDQHNNTITKIIPFKNTLYLLQMYNHRILVIKKKEIVEQIGQIGNGKGELYYPEDFVIDKNGQIYVYDGGNERIQIFDLKGNYINEFQVHPKSWGLTATTGGEILLGQPGLSSLISVYNLQGKKLREIGSLILPSEIYGSEYEEYNNSHKLPMNRVRLALDNDDNIWVAFLHFPLIIKYSKKGTLLLKKVLSIPNFKSLKNAVWKTPPPQEYGSINIDGIQLTMIIKDITFYPQKEQILILLGDERILALNLEGDEQFLINAKFKKGSIRNLSINKKGEIFVSIFFSPRSYKLIVQGMNSNV